MAPLSGKHIARRIVPCKNSYNATQVAQVGQSSGTAPEMHGIAAKILCIYAERPVIAPGRFRIAPERVGFATENMASLQKDSALLQKGLPLLQKDFGCVPEDCWSANQLKWRKVNMVFWFSQRALRGCPKGYTLYSPD